MRGKSTAATKGVGAELMKLIEQIGREKGIDPEILISALEDAITTASRKQAERTSRPRAGGEPAQEIMVCRLNRQTGELHLYARQMVVDEVSDPSGEISLANAQKVDPGAFVGGYVESVRSTKGLGRIEAQAAKQVIFQKVREAERELVYRDVAPKVGQLVNGTVKRFERGEVIVELGRAEGLLPRRFQSRIEMYSQGDRIRAIVVEVSKISKGPQVILSRTDPTLLIKLFEMEVPEIYDGTVLLKHAVREPGERAKVAVASREKDVDPVGACVGMKGSRVQAIIRELRGEKIDVVPWSDEVTTFAASALNPAKVGRVAVSQSQERTLEVIADDQQLSLAIGKKGQNVRLAAKLVGWRIDIKGEEEKRREVESTMAEMARRSKRLSDLEVLRPETVEVLESAEIRTIDDMLRATTKQLVEILGVAEKDVLALREEVETLLSEARNRDETAESAALQPEPELPPAAAASLSEPPDEQH